ncbi:hypothetical protein PVL30_002711 [Lodderomyces elongisporus]|uniref:uncharacterized protein n=1 Tax=Lodderomyces elongisporus TaxID=36914 RepID=UPI0029247925|nr:uncharacterized protein PVL30_002711 [Lodderomyces elongisporus]WLF78963.1 hypothetical protein PVL30_002711 [Lodderomyces elongisporus]
MSIPLYLNVKGSQTSHSQGGGELNDPCFSVTSPNTIKLFDETTYNFTHVFSNTDEQELFNLVESPINTCIALMGPMKTEGVHISCFELANGGKHIVDLLDSEPKKLSGNMLKNFESKLLRRKASPELVKHIFKSKSSSSPSAIDANDALSSLPKKKTCLVVTLYCQSYRITLIDDASLKGSFQQNGDNNSNNSLIQNFIFKNKQLKLVLNLDQHAETSIVQLHLNNLDLVINSYKHIQQSGGEEPTPARRVPSYTLPTVSSSRSPNKKIVKSTRPTTAAIANLSVATRVAPRITPRVTTQVASRVDQKYKISKPTIAKLSSSAVLTKKPAIPKFTSTRESKELEKLKADKEAMKSQYLENVQHMKSSIQGFKQDGKYLFEQITNLKNQLSLLETQGSQREQLCQELKQDKLVLSQDIENLHAQLDRLMDIKQANEDSIQQLESERDYINSELVLSNENNAELLIKNKELQEQVELAKRQQQEEQQQQEQKQQQQEQEQKQQQQQQQQHLEKQIAQIAQLEQQIDELKQQLDGKTNALNDITRECEKLEKKLEETNNSIATLKARESALVEEKDKLDEKLTGLNSKFDFAVKDNAELNSQLDKMKHFMTEKDTQIKQLNDQLLASKEEFENAKTSSDLVLQQQIKDLNERLDAKQEELNNFFKTEKAVREQLRESERQNQTLIEDLNSQASDSQKSGVLLDELQSLLDKATRDNTRLRKQSEEAQMQLSIEVEKYGKELADFQSRFDDKQNEWNNEKTKLESDHSRQTATLERLKQDLHNQEMKHHEEISKLEQAHALILAEKDSELKTLRLQPSHATIPQDFNNLSFGLNNQSSSPQFGFHPEDIYNDPIMEHTIHFNTGGQQNKLASSVSPAPESAPESVPESVPETLSEQQQKNINSAEPTAKSSSVSPASSSFKSHTSNLSQVKQQVSMAMKHSKKSSQNSSKHSTPKKNGILQPSNKQVMSENKVKKNKKNKLAGLEKYSSPLRHGGHKSSKSSPLKKVSA